MSVQPAEEEGAHDEASYRAEGACPVIGPDVLVGGAEGQEYAVSCLWVACQQVCCYGTPSSRRVRSRTQISGEIYSCVILSMYIKYMYIFVYKNHGKKQVGKTQCFWNGRTFTEEHQEHSLAY